MKGGEVGVGRRSRQGSKRKMDMKNAAWKMKAQRDLHPRVECQQTKNRFPFVKAALFTTESIASLLLLYKQTCVYVADLHNEETKF